MFARSGLMAAALILVAGSAAAWQDMTQPHDPNSPAPRAVAGPNYCRDGLRPMEWNGTIACGGTYQPSYTGHDSLHDVPADHDGRVYHLRYGNSGTQPLQ